MWPSSLAALLWLLLSGGSALAAVALDCPDTVDEGAPFLVRLRSDAALQSVRVEWLGKTLRPEPRRTEKGWEAVALLGMGLRERLKGDRHALQVRVESAQGAETHRKTVARRAVAYPEQHLTVSGKYASLSTADLARHARERKLVVRALATLTEPARWQLPFLRPVPGEASSPFGLRRFFNKQPRQPHNGLDLRGPEGTPVLAVAPGAVVLADDHFFSGKSVFLDHGEGVVSMYFHLSEIDVQSGDTVAAGDAIGAIGSTGRVTGPHLHLGTYILGQPVDPTRLLDPAFPNENTP